MGFNPRGNLEDFVKMMEGQTFSFTIHDADFMAGRFRPKDIRFRTPDHVECEVVESILHKKSK